jgi:hypothetical protein
VHRTIEVVLAADDDLRVNLAYDQDAVGHALVSLGRDDKKRWQNLVRALLIVLRGWDVVENGQRMHDRTLPRQPDSSMGPPGFGHPCKSSTL